MGGGGHNWFLDHFDEIPLVIYHCLLLFISFGKSRFKPSTIWDQLFMTTASAQSVPGTWYLTFHIMLQFRPLTCAFHWSIQGNSSPFSRQEFVVIFMSAGIFFQTVLGIRDILVQIRIRIPGSVPLTDGSGSTPFFSDIKDAKKIIFFSSYFIL